MERIEEKQIRWKKIGGGSFTLSNLHTSRSKIIKPNEVFTAFPSQIPEAFRSQVIPLDELPKVPEEVLLSAPPSVYTIQPKGGSGTWFDVVDAQGKVVNAKGLKKEKAEELVKELTA
jgi:hypothetical protein